MGILGFPAQRTYPIASNSQLEARAVKGRFGTCKRFDDSTLIAFIPAYRMRECGPFQRGMFREDTRLGNGVVVSLAG